MFEIPLLYFEYNTKKGVSIPKTNSLELLLYIQILGYVLIHGQNGKYLFHLDMRRKWCTACSTSTQLAA